MRAVVTIKNLKNNSYRQNSLYNRVFSFERLFLESELQKNSLNVYKLMKSDTQTGFVYLFMPWHRHCPGITG